MTDEDVTSGELYRLIQSMDKKLDRMHTDMVGRKEYEANQAEIARRFLNIDAIHNQLDNKVSSSKAELGVEIKEIKSGQAAAEKEQRSNRSKWILSMVTAAAAAVFSVIATIALQGGGAG